MHPRIEYWKIAPAAFKAMSSLEAYLRDCGFDGPFLHMVKLRASQINGCAYCIDMHTKDARAVGETEQRLYALAAWRETPFFTARERAALSFTETVTRLSETHVPTEAYDEIAAVFSTEEVAALLGLITVINAWNALSAASRGWVPGSYQP